MSGFPSSTGSISITLEAGWEQARQMAAAVKSNAQSLVSLAQGSGAPSTTILAFSALLANAASVFSSVASISGIVAYAQSQIAESNFDVAGAFTTMQSAVSSTISWIVTNFPHDANGNILYTQLNAQGLQTYTTFTPAQLTSFVTVLNSLIATID